MGSGLHVLPVWSLRALRLPPTFQKHVRLIEHSKLQILSVNSCLSIGANLFQKCGSKLVAHHMQQYPGSSGQFHEGWDPTI